MKFNDADLLGIPLRVTVGPRGVEAGNVELKVRDQSEAEEISCESAVSIIAERVARERTA